MKMIKLTSLLKVWLVFVTMDAVLALNDACNVSLVTGPFGVEDNALTGPLPYYPDDKCQPKYARISSPDYHAYIGSYLQVRLRQQSMITGFQIKGRCGNYQYVSGYTILFSDNDSSWNEFKDENGNVMTFPGNSDDCNVAESTISSPITASYIRVIPATWYSQSSFRLEIVGCPLPITGYQSCWKANSSIASIPYGMFTTTCTNVGVCGNECKDLEEDCYAFIFNHGSGLCQGLTYENYTSAVSQLLPLFGDERNTSLLFVKRDECP